MAVPRPGTHSYRDTHAACDSLETVPRVGPGGRQEGGTQDDRELVPQGRRRPGIGYWGLLLFRFGCFGDFFMVSVCFLLSLSMTLAKELPYIFATYFLMTFCMSFTLSNSLSFHLRYSNAEELLQTTLM